MKGKLFTGLILLIPVLIFVVQNGHSVTVRFLKWEYPVSLALLLLAILLIGVLLGVLLTYFRRMRNNRKQKKAEQEKQRQAVRNRQAEPAVQPDEEAPQEVLEPTEKIDLGQERN